VACTFWCGGGPRHSSKIHLKLWGCPPHARQAGWPISSLHIGRCKAQKKDKHPRLGCRLWGRVGVVPLPVLLVVGWPLPLHPLCCGPPQAPPFHHFVVGNPGLWPQGWGPRGCGPRGCGPRVGIPGLCSPFFSDLSHPHPPSSTLFHPLPCIPCLVAPIPPLPLIFLLGYGQATSSQPACLVAGPLRNES
jgi:hypothetical protein